MNITVNDYFATEHRNHITQSDTNIIHA